MTYELYIHCQIWTANRDRTMHWATRNDLTTNARWAAKIKALELKIPTLDRVAISATPMQSRGVLADPGAHFPAVKACIDGLRDARVLTDDTSTYVANVDMRPAERTTGRAQGIILRLEPVTA